MKRLITLASIFLIFFGIHTGIALAPGDKMLAPYVLSFVGGVAILAVNLSQIKFRMVVLYGVLALVLVICALITAQKDRDLPQHIISTGQLLYSLIIAYGTFIGLRVLGIRRASKTFLLAAAILIVGSFLEVYGGLKPVSDAFRTYVNSWQAKSVYSNDLRDEMDYGGIRPKLFASEPAILGRSIGYAILFWFLSARRFSGYRFLGASLLSVSAFFLVRSPTILICFVVVGVFFLAELGGRRRATSMWRKALSVTLLVSMLIAPGIVASATNYGQSASFFQREVGPPLVTAAVLRSQPFFGTGIGGWSQLLPYGQTVFSQAGGQSQAQLMRLAFDDPGGGKALLNSQVWEFWIDLGLVGGIIVFFILWRAIGALGIPDRFLILSCSAFLLTMNGGLVLPGGWVGLLSLACLYQMHTEALSEARPVTLKPRPDKISATLQAPRCAT